MNERKEYLLNEKKDTYKFISDIAIKQPNIVPSTVDREMENGEYRTSKAILPYLKTVDGFYKDKELVQETAMYRDDLIMPAMHYLYAFNSFLDVIAEVYKIDDLEVLKPDLDAIERQEKSFNNALYLVYANVQGTTEEKADKRRKIKEIFKEIDGKHFVPSDEALEALKVVLYDLGITREAEGSLRNMRSYIAQVMNYDQQ